MKNNKISSIILSVVVAFGLWLYVVTNVSQEDDVTFYNIPVVMEGVALLAEQNMMITDCSAQTISVNLSGRRSDLNKIGNGNLTAKVNLSGIERVGENIQLSYNLGYPDNVSRNDYTIESKNPAYIYVDVDYRRVKEVPVTLKWTGTRSEDYIYDTENAVLDNAVITIEGPAAVADKIHHAEIEIDLSEQVKSISDSYRYTLCDEEGNAVDAETITTDVEEVHLDVPIQRIREMQLAVDVIYGGGANADNTTIEIEPASLRLSGGEAVLAEIGDIYTVATLNLAEIEKSDSFVYTLNLPEGVTNQTGVSEVKVSVKFNGLRTKEFTLDNFQMINVPAGMTAEIINASLTVKVRGPGDELNALTEEDIMVVVDFAEAEAGTSTYKATIVFAEAFPNMGALKTHSVSATVLQAEE